MCRVSGSREYSEDSLKLACDYQATLNASFGGTEILRPLQAIYSKPPMITHSRQVIVRTICISYVVLITIKPKSFEHGYLSILLALNFSNTGYVHCIN